VEKAALHQKRKEGSDQEDSGPLRRGWTWNSGKINCGNENRAACLEWLTLQGRKAKLMAVCLKGLWTCKVKNIVAWIDGVWGYCSVKRGCLRVYYDNKTDIKILPNQ